MTAMEGGNVKNAGAFFDPDSTSLYIKNGHRKDAREDKVRRREYVFVKKLPSCRHKQRLEHRLRQILDR